MTQEEKQLLLKDLCGRLPYGVKVKNILNGNIDELRMFSLPAALDTNFLPYLRPMSSMTEEEKYEYRHMLGATLNSEGESIMFVYVEDFPIVIDYLNAHHLDYRGLIPMGLALEAKEGMYKTE